MWGKGRNASQKIVMSVVEECSYLIKATTVVPLSSVVERVTRTSFGSDDKVSRSIRLAGIEWPLFFHC